jgi:uncharacterized coiled-coil DUF342 family protein
VAQQVLAEADDMQEAMRALRSKAQEMVSKAQADAEAAVSVRKDLDSQLARAAKEAEAERRRAAAADAEVAELEAAVDAAEAEAATTKKALDGVQAAARKLTAQVLRRAGHGWLAGLQLCGSCMVLWGSGMTACTLSAVPCTRQAVLE